MCSFFPSPSPLPLLPWGTQHSHTPWGMGCLTSGWRCSSSSVLGAGRKHKGERDSSFYLIIPVVSPSQVDTYWHPYLCIKCTNVASLLGCTLGMAGSLLQCWRLDDNQGSLSLATFSGVHWTLRKLQHYL